MAIGKSGYFDLTCSKPSTFFVRVNWSETYEITTNKSVVTITSIQVKSMTWSGFVYYPDGLIKINGEIAITMNANSGTHSVYAEIDKWKDIKVDNEKATGSVEVDHNADGSKSISIEVCGNRFSKCSFHTSSGGTDGASGWGVTGSKTIELTTIPRASSVSLSVTSVDVGSTIDANITRASSAFTHTVEFYINSTYYQAYTEVNTLQSFTIPTTWYSAMPTATSCTAYCRITTYNGSTQIGDIVRTSFTVNVPSNIVPTIGEITLDPTDINGNNILVKGKNALKISVSNCSAGIGSSIKSYTFSGPSLTATTTTDTSIIIPSVSSTGDLTYTVKVIDNRGRSNSKTMKISCYDYFAPSFKSFSAYRANSNGEANVNGTYLKCTYATNYASVNSTNSVTVTMYYNSAYTTVTNGSALINLNGNTSTTYSVYLRIEDAYGGSSTSNTLSVFGETRIFNVTEDGTGFAIGKIADSNNLFECRWNAKFDGTASGPSGFSTSSDKRVKKNIQNIDMDIIDKLRPVQYELVQSVDGKVHYGFVAQEVDELLSDVGLNSDTIGLIGQIVNNGRQEYVLTYTEFIPLLTKKCQLLQCETDMLKKEIAELKDMIKQISS